MGGYQNSLICIIVFKRFHSGDRFQKFTVTVGVFTGYVWTLRVTATKCLRIQTNPDTCGRGLKHAFWLYSKIILHNKNNGVQNATSYIFCLISIIYTMLFSCQVFCSVFNSARFLLREQVPFEANYSNRKRLHTWSSVSRCEYLTRIPKGSEMLSCRPR